MLNINKYQRKGNSLFVSSIHIYLSRGKNPLLSEQWNITIIATMVYVYSKIETKNLLLPNDKYYLKQRNKNLLPNDIFIFVYINIKYALKLNYAYRCA
jgi:hypothetical protein